MYAGAANIASGNIPIIIELKGQLQNAVILYILDTRYNLYFLCFYQPN